MKVGNYVRTKKHGIGKIISFSYQEDDECCFIELSKRRTGIKKSNIIKSSPNIIDLIEVGDILVIKDFVDEACMIFTDIYLIQNEEQLLHIKNDLEKNKNKMLYSIVTKEQFKNMEYEVK